jgi:bla regulator protein BlaR1
MTSKPARWWKAAAALLGSVSIALVVVAAQVSPPNATTSADGAPEANQVDPAVYDNYVGHYEFDDSRVMTVSKDGQRLITQVTGQPPFEIFPSSETEFFYKVVKAKIRFTTDAQGHATSLILQQNGMTFAAPRIDDGKAQQIEERLAARVQSQTAQPGSEAALRELIAGLTSGNPDYSKMTPELAKLTREQLPKLQKNLEQSGPVRSIEFRGVGSQGWDVYDVRQDTGITTWRLTLNADGKIARALMQRGP